MGVFVTCKPLAGLLLIILCSSVIVALNGRLNEVNLFDTVCKDENSAPLDWFIVYKFPQGKDISEKSNRNKTSGHFMDGLGYGYITSDNVWKSRFVLSNYSIDDQENSMIMQTLKPIYEANDISRKLHKTPLMYAMWNNQTPLGGGGKSVALAHSKGVLMVNKSSRRASLLIHSVPQFPRQRKSSDEFFPASEKLYAHAFMCISFEADYDADAVAKHLDYIKPIIYDSFFSKGFIEDHPLYGKFEMNEARRTTLKLKGPKKLKQTIATLAGREIDLIAKTRGYKTDIYSTLISDLYGPLYVQSRRSGRGGSLHPSDNVCNVDNITLLDEKNNELTSWTGSKDHAKWAITREENDRRVVCIGDIDRMESQFTRGGGTLCMEDDEAWKAMRSMISSYESSNLNAKFVSTWFDDASEDSGVIGAGDSDYDSQSDYSEDDGEDGNEDDRTRRAQARNK